MEVTLSDEKSFIALAKERNPNNILSFCEERELEYVGLKNKKKIPKYFYHIYLVSYLIVYDLANARFLWKRTPKEFQNEELMEIWNLGRAMWFSNYGTFYQKATSYKWSSTIKPYIDSLINQYRMKILQLVTKAYSSIKIVDLSTKLGLDGKFIGDYVKDLGWKIDKEYAFPIEMKNRNISKMEGVDFTKIMSKNLLFLELNNE